MQNRCQGQGHGEVMETCCTDFLSLISAAAVDNAANPVIRQPCTVQGTRYPHEAGMLKI